MAEAGTGWKKIVVGVALGEGAEEISPASAGAIHEAELLAKHFGASVTLLHSTANDEVWDESRDEYVQHVGLTESGRAALEEAREGLLRASIDTRLLVSEEHPLLAIVSEVVSGHADLVIGAKRTVHTKDGRQLGSVARRLLHDCPVPVWLVRATRRAAPRCVLAAADLSEVGDRVVRSAAAVANAFGSELHVVHALTMTLDMQMARLPEREAMLKHSAAEAGQRISAALEGRPAEIHVGVTSPTQAVLAGEKRLDPDLVVMGSVARGGVQGFVLGNTAERLLDRLDTSLMVVKPEGFRTPLSL